MKRKPLLLVLIICFVTACCTLFFTGCPSGSEGSSDNKEPMQGLEYELNNRQDGYTVIGIGTAKAKKIVIPAEYLGLPVTFIGGYAFNGCSSLTSITIPDSVTYIDGEAFSDCSSLKSIIIPDSKTLISGCKNSVIPTDGSVTTIDVDAFNNCTSLTNLSIPDSVTSISRGVFRGCSSLKSITVDNGNTVYHSAGNCLIKTESKMLILGCKNSVIPTDGSVTTINDYAFDNCSSLKNITIPNSVTYIGDSAFNGCSSLKNITIPNSVSSIGSVAFAGCTSLTSIAIPNGVTTINSFTFNGCTALESIIIPDSVSSIGSQALYGCTALESITIPNSVTSIRGTAFANCSSLERITVDSGNTIYHSSGNCLILTEDHNLILGCKNSVIPTDGSVTMIGSSAFSGCSSLKSIIIPICVTYIGAWAFSNCSSLTSIIVPISVKYIGLSTFSECPNLTIYCEAKEEQSRDWDSRWNPDNCPVVWG